MGKTQYDKKRRKADERWGFLHEWSQFWCELLKVKQAGLKIPLMKLVERRERAMQLRKRG